jgi:polyisoprenoid-binding protein YceI
MSTTERTLHGASLPPAGTYQLDITHTAVEFVARHMLSKVRGRFTEFSGTIEVADDPTASTVHVEIQAASITTNTEMRDNHLKSGDFLQIEDHPTLTFDSTAIRIGEGSAFELDGNLTIKAISKPVTLHGEFLGWGPDMQGKAMLAASAKTTIEREDWDMTWNVAVETGGVLVGKKVDIEIELEATLIEG